MEVVDVRTQRAEIELTGARAAPTPATQDCGAGPLERTARITFDSRTALLAFVASLCSQTYGTLGSPLVLMRSGIQRDDLDVGEIVQRLKADLVDAIGLGDPGAVGSPPPRIDLGVETGTTVSISIFLTEERATDLVWLQSDPDHVTALPLLAVPARHGVWQVEATHALVALACRTGGFQAATLESADGERLLDWTVDRTADGDHPLTAALTDVRWSLGDADTDGALATAWCTSSIDEEARPTAGESWWAEFDALT